ncbi:hypothetical protein GCM10029964_007840 [Kibdelosporangium lantanae]
MVFDVVVFGVVFEEEDGDDELAGEEDDDVDVAGEDEVVAGDEDVWPVCCPEARPIGWGCDEQAPRTAVTATAAAPMTSFATRILTPSAVVTRMPLKDDPL